ncbi:MAG: M48 family metallopeptidase [Lachnospiraceae bacterium]|nr:M48 family metallopeptidase [Lachnospiraceae bacterium]
MMGKKRKQDYFEGRKVYELTEEEQQACITKKEADACRHKAERRWYRRLVVLNILIIVAVIAILVCNLAKVQDWAELAMAQANEEFSADYVEDKTQYRYDAFQDIPFALEIFAYGVLIMIIVIPVLYYMYAQYRSMALRITEKNFPEVYTLIEEYAHRLGIRVPKAYVVQQNGVLNAFSAYLPRRQWICIHSELFEVAYREHKDKDALAFVIAHEMAHIYYKHATFGYYISIMFSQIIPILGTTASRTREYSCDRLAQRLTGTDGLDAMLVLVVDRHLYKLVDKEDYIEDMRSQRGFFLWVFNLLADHPVMCKRIVALAEGRGSGKLY